MNTISQLHQKRCKTLPLPLQETANFIVSVQRQDGSIPWFDGGKLDPWDHTEAAMGLSVAGLLSEAEKAYLWLADNQLSDGGWLSTYFCEEDEFTSLRQCHFVAYIATGVWHHYLITEDLGFLHTLFPCVCAAIDRVIQYQSPEHGDIAWAYNEDGQALDDALVTGCASILRSLNCAERIAQTIGRSQPAWQTATTALTAALRHKPERFDRNWESKQRFAMDWYYPILAGAHSTAEAKAIIQRRWDEFVEPDLGCRCVSDEPWVTMAETSELIMALVSAGMRLEAETLFDHIQQWRNHGDGGYWTGYVFRDDTIWPEEKTTWTASAVLLAADALYHYTPASQLFCRPNSHLR